jgi:hypothetical protein
MAGIAPVPLAAIAKDNVHSERFFYTDYNQVYHKRETVSWQTLGIARQKD